MKWKLIKPICKNKWDLIIPSMSAKDHNGLMLVPRCLYNISNPNFIIHKPPWTKVRVNKQNHLLVLYLFLAKLSQNNPSTQQINCYFHLIANHAISLQRNQSCKFKMSNTNKINIMAWWIIPDHLICQQ